jgi:hypothetical protein
MAKKRESRPDEERNAEMGGTLEWWGAEDLDDLEEKVKPVAMMLNPVVGRFTKLWETENTQRLVDELVRLDMDYTKVSIQQLEAVQLKLKIKDKVNEQTS